MNAALLILHVVMGLGVAAHGARKLFGWFAGGGINATGASAQRTRPPRTKFRPLTSSSGTRERVVNLD